MRSLANLAATLQAALANICEIRQYISSYRPGQGGSGCKRNLRGPLAECAAMALWVRRVVPGILTQDVALECFRRLSMLLTSATALLVLRIFLWFRRVRVIVRDWYGIYGTLVCVDTLAGGLGPLVGGALGCGPNPCPGALGKTNDPPPGGLKLRSNFPTLATSCGCLFSGPSVRNETCWDFNSEVSPRAPNARGRPPPTNKFFSNGRRFRLVSLPDPSESPRACPREGNLGSFG